VIHHFAIALQIGIAIVKEIEISIGIYQRIITELDHVLLIVTGMIVAGREAAIVIVITTGMIVALPIVTMLVNETMDIVAVKIVRIRVVEIVRIVAEMKLRMRKHKMHRQV
jgi:hypothetical protein